MNASLGLGKYRDLLLAILLFIVLDLGILFFNFFASIQLERDASRINTAGELRMLTQQITKSLLTLQIETRDGLLVQTSMAQLGQGTAAFNQGLRSRRPWRRAASSVLSVWTPKSCAACCGAWRMNGARSMTPLPRC